ncbi:MAG: biopolymer transporter ExbD [Myxococcota bacterium]
MAASTQSDEEINGINVTPLVDVVLVLLVIVMVAASFEVAQSIPVSLPEAATGEQSSGPLMLSLNASGAWFLDGEAAQPDGVRAAVRSAREGSATVRALIAADESVPHGRVIELVDLLREERVVDFAFNVTPTREQPGAP